MNIENLVEIDKKKFYNIIYYFKLDVHPYYPETRQGHWKMRNHDTFGASIQDKHWPYTEKYYVTKQWAERSGEIPENFTR